MPEELEGDQKVTNEEPSRRTFLKVSAVAGATVAAIAAGASVIPKIASTGAAAAKSASNGKEEAEAPAVTSAVSSDPLIMVVRGDAVDVYRGESKVAVQDATLAKELTSRIAAKVQ
jgi:hypothetical protein